MSEISNTLPAWDWNNEIHEEKINSEDFGFYIDDFPEQYTGISGVIFVCVDLLYEDNLGPRLRLWLNNTPNPCDINPYKMIPIFFNKFGTITCDVDLVNIKQIQRFITNNLETLLNYWNHIYDSGDLRNKIVKIEVSNNEIVYCL
jgi:hypothetical protein